MDEKWKASKKDIGSSSSSQFSRSFSTKNSSGGSSSSKGFNQQLKRSSSVKTYNCTSKAPLMRSSSLKSSPPRDSPPYPKGSSITRKYTSIAKEQKTRFYIMRRCVAMLVCWHKHGES